jgi:hypothetical protein
LSQLEGYPNYPPVYTQQQSTDVLQATRNLIQRYKAVVNDTYVDEAATLLMLTNNANTDQTLGNTKLKLSIYGANAKALLMYTENGTDFEAKSLNVNFQNHAVTEFRDDWFLFKVGSTQINISRDQAVLAAKAAAESFSWNVNGTKVTNVQIVDNPVSVVFYPKTRTEPLILIPYWLVTLYLDRTYPGGVNAIVVGVWADTGEVVNIQTLSGQSSP